MAYDVKLTKVLLRQANEDSDILNAVAFTVAIKMKYSSSAVHHYDINSLKKEFKCSYDTISSAIKTGIKLGMLRIDDNVLVANRIASSYHDCFRKSKDTTIHLEEEVTIKNVKRELLNRSIIDYIGVRNKVCSLKNTSREPNTLKEYRNAKKLIQKWGVDKFDTSNGISYSSIARRLNISTRKAIYVIKYLADNGVIKKEVQPLKRVNCFNAKFEIFFENYSFLYKNITFYQEPNRYSLDVF